MRHISRYVIFVVLLGASDPAVTGTVAQAKRPLTNADIDAIATLLKLEDTRTFDEVLLDRILKSTHLEVRRRAAVAIGRIAKEQGRALLVTARTDANVEVVASVAFATGQLKDPAAVPWLAGLLEAPRTPAVVAREAAQALGKMNLVPEARIALARYLMAAPTTPAAIPVVGEALLAWGRFAAKDDLAPILRWVMSPSVEIRWRAAWALFRPRDPAAVPHLLKLAADPSPEVRSWAVRGLTPALVDSAAIDRAATIERLRSLVKQDTDRRVRVEALRTLVQYPDETAFLALVNALYSTDSWVAVSAAEAAGRFTARAQVLAPVLVDVSEPADPLSVRLTALPALVTLAPGAAVKLAWSLAHSDVGVARSAAFQALGRLGEDGSAALAELRADPAMAALLPQTGGGRATQPAAPARTDADYRQLVLKWIVPDYNGRPGPHAIWETPRGTIELELYPGDAPMGVEYFMKSIRSGDIVGTEFGRVVPDFVAQQQTIRNAPTLRDEVNRHGLTRGNLAWASSGLDTGRPGYTLGNTPQPHNEGNFTALGRVVRGMDVMDKLELGDKIISATIK